MTIRLPLYDNELCLAKNAGLYEIVYSPPRCLCFVSRVCETNETGETKFRRIVLLISQLQNLSETR